MEKTALSGKKSELAILGASGHAQVVAEVARAAGYTVVGFYDDDATLWQQQVLGVPVLGAIDLALPQLIPSVFVGIGVNRTRQRLYECFVAAGHDFPSLIHPAALVQSNVEINSGTVCVGAVAINTGSRIGVNVILNTHCTVDHHNHIGDHCHIAPGVHLAGDVHTGEGTFIGIGASVIQGIRIGKWCTVGAGSVVIRDLPDYAVAVGVPARIIRIEQPF